MGSSRKQTTFQWLPLSIRGKRGHTYLFQNASYTYNGQGKRTSKTVNSTTTKYYYDGDELIAEKTGASSIYYIHSPRIDEILSDSRGYYYHTDGLGSVVSLTDTTGTKAADYTYKAFGLIRNQSGSISNPWLFTGRQFDQESGLYFYRNRYYDARAGRFITRDPAGFIDGANLYTYVKNNPINFTDPFGLYEVGFKGMGNAVAESIISEEIKNLSPEMPDETRKKAAKALRKEMTVDEYKKFKERKGDASIFL